MDNEAIFPPPGIHTVCLMLRIRHPYPASIPASISVCLWRFRSSSASSSFCHPLAKIGCETRMLSDPLFSGLSSGPLPRMRTHFQSDFHKHAKLPPGIQICVHNEVSRSRKCIALACVKRPGLRKPTTILVGHNVNMFD